jgi:hypothetical protein
MLPHLIDPEKKAPISGRILRILKISHRLFDTAGSVSGFFISIDIAQNSENSRCPCRSFEKEFQQLHRIHSVPTSHWLLHAHLHHQLVLIKQLLAILIPIPILRDPQQQLLGVG